MVRSFPTRFPNSLTRTVLLVPCLLICLSCATPFPIESLEKGMTAETARENFGAPEAIETKPEGVDTSWTYVDEKQMWQMFIFPQAIIAIPILALISDTPWDYLYVTRRTVLLHFEDERLARWNVGEFSWTPSPASFSSRPTFQGMDAAHHAQGHTHHHGHGC